MNAGSGKSCSVVLYLLRHADCRPDAVKRYIGQTDYPLNEQGIRQAAGLARVLKKVPFSGIYCSDLQRSQHTASIIAGERENLVHPLPEFKEIHLGQWDGLAMEAVRSQYPEEYRKRGADLVNFRPPEGESFHDLAVRIIPHFCRLMSQANGHMLLVGHAGVNRVILCHILGMPLSHLFRLQQDYGGVNVIVGTPEEMRLAIMNSRPFSGLDREVQHRN